MIPFHVLLAVMVASPEAFVEQLRRDGAREIRVDRVQLDSDAELEAVVRFEQEGTGAFAVVLDLQKTEWREVGRFNTWWNYVRADGERLVEWRETVEAGVKDLVVRTRSGGTEDSRTVLEVWRLRAGRMVPVLTVTEQETAMEHPSGDVYSTAARVGFELGRVTVEAVRQPGEKRTSAAFVWNAAQFRFVDAP